MRDNELKKVFYSKYHRETPVKKINVNETLYKTILATNQNNLDYDAIGFMGKSITFRKLFENVDRLADAYVKQGVKQGDVVAICTINLPAVQENLLALSKIGAVSKWIDLRIKETDLRSNLLESGCKIIVIFDGVVSILENILDDTKLEKVLVVSPLDYLTPVARMIAGFKGKKKNKLPDDRRYMEYSSFLKTGNTRSDVQPTAFVKGKPSIIVQSSGSTGKAKSIIHTEYNFNSEMLKESYTDLPLHVGQVMYVTIPPFIVYGLVNSVYACLMFGMKAEMMPFMVESCVYDALGKFDISCGAPFHYRHIYHRITDLKRQIDDLEKQGTSNKELKKLRSELAKKLKGINRVKVFISGGDKISLEELIKIEQLLEKPIINGYGNNELVGAAVISPVHANKPGSIGIPMIGISVAAFDPDTHERLDTGTEGEICIYSDSVFTEYLNNPAETERIKRLHPDGLTWIHTGDLGMVDSDGYVYITGRSQRLIKRTAFKISPAVIENIIQTIDFVEDCTVVGVPDQEELEVPMAYIVVSSVWQDKFEEAKALIEDKCRQELPDYEVPKYFAQIDKIPYKNNKQEFKLLEKMGAEYVAGLADDD